MRILFVASRNSGRVVPFVSEQAEALRRQGVECEVFGVVGKGVRGYLGNLKGLRETIRVFRPDVIHAHYGFCGLLACMQRRVPVVVTYHGSDINVPSIRKFSRIAMRLAAFNILVSKKTMDLAPKMKNSELIPCGINLEDFPEVSEGDARSKMGLNPAGRLVLFAGAFDNPVKCPELAEKVMVLRQDATLVELKGYDRQGVAALMAASNALLMTSLTEGSPQVVKEALASGLPVVSVDVGSVSEMISGLPGCKVCSRDPKELAEALEEAFASGHDRAQGRRRLVELGLTNDVIAGKLIGIYNRVSGR